jgi:hypothetical protein
VRTIIEGDLRFSSILRRGAPQWLQRVQCRAENIAGSLTRQRGNLALWAIVAVVAATWTLSGCSPYLYQKEIGSFSSSVGAVSNGVTQGLNNLDQDQAAADLAQVVNERKGVNLSQGCASEKPTEPCRLMPVPNKVPAPYPADEFASSKPQLLKVLSALKGYADGLAAVTNAQDRKDYNAAASQLASNVAGLGAALGAVYPPAAAAGPALSAAVTFATWTIGQGLDAARYDTLKSAINAVGTPSILVGGASESPIQVVNVKAITPALAAVRSARITLIYQQLQARTDRINLDLKSTGAAHISMERYDAHLMDSASLVATLNAIKAVDPTTVGNSLVTAHNDLQKAVNNKSTQFQSLVSSIADFANQAAAVEKAFTKKPTATTSAAK